MMREVDSKDTVMLSEMSNLCLREEDEGGPELDKNCYNFPVIPRCNPLDMLRVGYSY